MKTVGEAIVNVALAGSAKAHEKGVARPLPGKGDGKPEMTELLPRPGGALVCLRIIHHETGKLAKPLAGEA